MNSQTQIKPYDQQGSKKEQIASMFNSIAHRYDLLNRSLSVGIDTIWRKKLIATLKGVEPKTIIDVATGTGDVAIATMELGPKKVVGVDISVGMLAIGKEKIAKKGLGDQIELVEADSEDLPFEDNTFDAATVAFGVRNFEDLLKGLKEINRVLRPSGKLAVLEFSQPTSFPIKQLYWFYFSNILPVLGRMLSKDRSAYTYLPASVKAFPDGEKFTDAMDRAGFKRNTYAPLTFGIATIYTGVKA